ncbi:protein FAR1-RELATED SEQUENCE 5-like [Cynara cardunculus var. scolymus]|uniref:protein FAR1-RELATED SEQUENCE 5-like n=1 Tax=Cynara cardunculus var. scolymus TaxID=59895 RepID=UPI000D624DFB|nr:protein FAR1-RELATED SEQUENCE 5-like [Cynara cardunculus var. scolymus]
MDNTSVNHIDNNGNGEVKHGYGYVWNLNSGDEEDDQRLSSGVDNIISSQQEIDYDIVESSKGIKFFTPKVDDVLKPKTNTQYASMNEVEKMYRTYADNADFDNRQMKYTDFKTVLNNSSYKVGARRAHRIQTALNGGFEHTRVSEINFKNFKRDAVACVGNKDAKMLINKLSNRLDIVPGFFFEYKCNEQELSAIFWADEVARINYKEFGDVISFDGTFRTNKHAMIFVPFLAVDNHKASVVVGSALISDQCSAMKQAIPMVFTEAKHRLCMWHIMKKVLSKVSATLNHDPNFNKVINKLVWNIHIGPMEFETRWHEMIHQFNLGGDTWFTKMYEIRHSWIPAYYKDTPMSGLMKTTSRSESSNSYINIYESYWFDLVQFLNNYDVAIEKQRYKQSIHENVTRTTNPKFATLLRLESHASSIYSRNVFFDIQKEIKKVCRNYSTNTVECDCNLFTHNEYLCRHAFKVLINDEVESILEKYVLRRWKRQLVPVQIQSARVRYGELDAEKEECIIDVYSKVDDIVSIARNDKSILARLGRNLDIFMGDIEKEVPYENPSQQKLDAIRDHLGVSIPDEVDILPPSGIRNKGCGTGKRLDRFRCLVVAV